MRIGTLVILIGSEGVTMPPLGAEGEVVGHEEDGDVMVEFPNYPCPAGPGVWWACERRWLLPIGEPPKFFLTVASAPA